MKSVVRVLALALALGCALARPAPAQVYERPIDEGLLQRMLPLLRAEVRGNERLAAEREKWAALEKTRRAASAAAAAEIAAGADALTWLHAHAPSATAPSTAVYDAACSTALTASDHTPAAAFSFGVAASPTWLAVLDIPTDRVPLPPAGTRGSPAAARGSRPESLVQTARSFYAGRGFEYRGEVRPFEWVFLARDRTVEATVSGVNRLTRLAPCDRLATGPLVIVQARGEVFAKGPAEEPPPTNRDLGAALAKAGMNEMQYLNLKVQLLNARLDAQDPSRLDRLPASTAEQRRTADIRRENAVFYRQHQNELDSLLTALSR